MILLWIALYLIYPVARLIRKRDQLIVNSYLAAPRKRQALAVFVTVCIVTLLTWPLTLPRTVWLALKWIRKLVNVSS